MPFRTGVAGWSVGDEEQRKPYSQLPPAGLVLIHVYSLAHGGWMLCESSIAFLYEHDLNWSWTLVCSVPFTGGGSCAGVTKAHVDPKTWVLRKGLTFISFLCISFRPVSVPLRCAHLTQPPVTSPVGLSDTWRFLMLFPHLEQSLLATLLVAGSFFTFRSQFLLKGFL